MGGLLHLIDIEQSSMARKVVADKRHGGGLDAPRNSLEIPIKTYQNYYAIEDNIPYMYQLTNDWSKKNYYQTEAPMKKLISEEISKRPNSTRHNSPSIVARLMGVDTLPLDTKPGAQHAEKKKEKPVTDFLEEKKNKSSSIYDVPFSSKLIKFDPFHHNEDKDSDKWSSNTNPIKPRPREHPQEEELQKFKKEFEAFQAARLKECTKVVELGTVPSQWIAQDNLNKEKMALYANSARKFTVEKPKELEVNYVKASPPKRESFPSTKIVILRPGMDNIGIEKNEESRASSSGTSEERGNMEEFLEEVKERLKCEIQGKSFKRGNIVRGGGIETPFSERPSDPKQIAQRIAKQVRESVSMNLGSNLLRSESTRSYRNEVMMNNGTGSPEFISRDTRRFLSERLRNVLKRETHQEIPMVNQEQLRSSRSDKGRSRLNRVSYWDSGNDEHNIQSRSFRSGPDNDVMSPSNLVRSLSAPVSGTAFGKLLLEDRHVSTGTHIRRKHETIERVGVKVKKQKKERFNNLREKVSSFKYSFTLRGRLFGRKIQSAEESLSKERDFLRNIMSGPTVMTNFGSRYENSTEVPPSPASVCSSVHDEYWRAVDNLSPTSSSNIPSSPLFFKDISSNLNELRRQLNQLETDDSEDTTTQDQPLETEMPELEDQTESYIRDLLVASGLYDGSLDKSLPRWDPFTKPISNCVFEEVEESYTKNTESTKDYNENKVVDHKLLFDLLNEVLSAVLGPPVTMSRFKKKTIGAMWQPPCGRKLLDYVWDVMCVYVYPLTDRSKYSLDSMVGQDLVLSPWSGLMNDNVDLLGKEIECWIIGDLIEEMVKDMRSQ